MRSQQVPPLAAWLDATYGVTPPPGISLPDWLHQWGSYAGYAGVIASAMRAIDNADTVHDQTALDALEVGTVIYYAAYYDGLRHTLAQRGVGGWFCPVTEAAITPLVPARIIHRPHEGRDTPTEGV